jgi:hypothetical protein
MELRLPTKTWVYICNKMRTQIDKKLILIFAGLQIRAQCH